VTRHFARSVFAALGVVVFCSFSAPVFAQTAPEDDDPARLRPLEPDFKITNLPTTLPLPVHAGNFELTHRFGGNLRGRDFGDVASDLFGIDEGATISLGYRFGLAKNLEVAANRTNFDRAIQFQAKYDAFREGAARPVGLSAIVSIEGGNNFRRDYAPALGLAISRTIGDVLAVYVDPFWVHNSAGIGSSALGTRDTGFVGVGGRLRLIPGTFITAELSPRVGGYQPGDTLYAFAIEKRVGGHVFQLNFGNSTAGATYGQIARGGNPGGLFMGFNLERKFY
jgi:uncharacterized beta barrel domain-containing protein DUF5777